MISSALPSFWAAYRDLDDDIRHRARKAYRPWSENPFHPSLRFKCVNPKEGVWSVRITLGYQALGLVEGDSVTWFWIGSHDSYERFLS